MILSALKTNAPSNQDVRRFEEQQLELEKLNESLRGYVEKAFNQDIRVLMLTTFNDREYIIEAMKAGANGYFLKDTPFEKIVKAIKTVHIKGIN